MTVGQLLDALKGLPPESPVVVEAHYPDGIIHAIHLYLDSDQGPSDDLDELQICWTPQTSLLAVIEEWNNAVREATTPKKLP